MHVPIELDPLDLDIHISEKESQDQVIVDVSDYAESVEGAKDAKKKSDEHPLPDPWTTEDDFDDMNSLIGKIVMPSKEEITDNCILIGPDGTITIILYFDSVDKNKVKCTDVVKE